ncbi:Thiol-disulfide isomerase or thioredoxin [Belliella buryatensis]|uniref:Thiol-disulfide isomerase or thioredoxin n=1 Tax=Belliella buryatensis TaxID=1500549 RepID=A0A239BU30_9BACT|nr:TlpA disulfide reductase family protein [Belliella buryatensis]SNS11132.1 Thiol-disulfide isomerase or thioredoxin [Belliella buryatensis]
MKFFFYLFLTFLLSSNLFAQNAILDFQLKGTLKKNEYFTLYMGGEEYQSNDLSNKKTGFEVGKIEQISLLKLTNKGKILGSKGFWVVPGEYTITGTIDPFQLQIDPVNGYQNLQNQIIHASTLSAKLEIIESNLDNLVAIANLRSISNQLEADILESLIEKIDSSLHQNKTYLQLESDLLKREFTKSGKGEVFTAFELENKGGGIVSLEDLKGKPTLIEFTFTGCAGCVKILPELREVYDQYEGKLNVISIYSDKTRKTFENNNPIYKKELVTWTSLWDPTNFVCTVNQINTYPTFVLLNENGEVIDQFQGGLYGKIKRKIAALNLE